MKENTAGTSASNHAIIFDVDWAPDFVIDSVAAHLLERKLRTTWYITHSSPATDHLFDHPEIFEVGIHPNFLPNSSQGKNEDEVIDFCGKMAPLASSMRTHAYYQSSLLFSKIIYKLPITSDASIFMPKVTNLQPFKYQVGERSIMRFPVYWEDDYEMKMAKPIWSITNKDLDEPGLKIFAFHPLHVYLNSHSISEYFELKKSIPDISTVAESKLAPFIQYKRDGVKTFIDLLIAFSDEKVQFRSISDISNDTL